ncbi:MAG: class IV adenylate cyclase [Halalkalicoccus sp.]
MYEVEMKLRADHERVRRALAERGADGRGTLVQRDTYYDAPTQSFAETDEALRVRRERADDDATVSAKLTYKGPRVGETGKSREERELGIEDSDVMDGILESLGFEAVETVEKERVRFSLDGCVVTLDTVTGLGEFVEVETEAEDGALEAARAEVADAVESLGLDPASEIRTSYLELLLGDSS